MNKFFVLFLVLVTGSTGFASDFSPCSKFAGRYSKQVDNRDTFSSQGLKIAVYPAGSSMELTYNSDSEPSQWRGWIESYIADGAVHVGDANTGKTYVALCTSDKISIKREGLLLKPIVTEITFSGDQLFYVTYVEGGEARATFMKLKKVQ